MTIESDNAIRLMREGMTTAAEIADECGAVLVAKKIREHAHKHLAIRPTTPTQEGSSHG